MKTKEQFLKQSVEKRDVYTKNSVVFLLSIVPFMLFEFLTHKMIFLEFSFVLFVIGVYYLRQLICLNERLEFVREVQSKIKKTNIKKIYPEGHHLIANPKSSVLLLGAYSYVGTDNHGIKIYQNITDIVVCGSINPENGEVVYDEYGVPAYLVK